MNLPILIKQLYGEFSFTGLYSFEFVNKGKKITEIFFMMPPKDKSVKESTRSTTNPTLGGNYVTDAGNATKQIDLSGELWFPHVGSPSNPLATDVSGFSDTIDGLTEFFKLRWMLIRYRDYTLTKNGKIDIPTIPMMASNEISALYKKVSKLIKEGRGALYDEVQLIFHDYDMDDHFYCRIGELSASQSSSKYIAIDYRISVDCYQRFYAHHPKAPEQKKTLNEEINILNTQIQTVDVSGKLDSIDPSKSTTNTAISNSNIYSQSLQLVQYIDDINTANQNIQSGTATPYDDLLPLLKQTSEASIALRSEVIKNVLTEPQQIMYTAGDFTIDTVVDYTMMSFFNSIQKVGNFATNMIGAIVSTPKQNVISFYANSDEFTLSSNQFSNANDKKIVNTSEFYYYEVQQGDTSRIVALRELGDAEKCTQVLQINGISESDFIDGTIIGTKIKIPYDAASAVRTADNLVYEGDTSDLNAFIHGSSIAPDINNNMQVSATGDILGYSGVQVTYDAVTNRLNNKKSSLNVFSPDWGLTPIGDSNSPLIVRIGKYLDDLTAQIQADPRVESVKIDIKKLTLIGESITIYGTINFLGTDEQKDLAVTS